MGHLTDGVLGRQLLNELADLADRASVEHRDLTADHIDQELRTVLSGTVQHLHTPDAHPVTPGGRAVGEAIAAHPATRWWAADMAPAQIGLQDVAYVGPRADRPLGWWSTPPDALLTSRELPGTGACVHLTHRDDYEGEPSRPLLWDADVVGARIHEVHTPEDWRALVELRPREHPSDIQLPWDRPGRPRLRRRSRRTVRLYQPDWALVASRYDGVHVSLAGLLTSGYTLLPVADGFTYLAGWHPDVTAWLNPSSLFRDGPRPLRLGMPQL